MEAREFERWLLARAGDVEALLGRLIPPERGGLGERRLSQAIRHAVLGGGKRLRPFLLVETAALFGGDQPGVLRAAAALECVHCYSLVHDDLPSMDDDDVRRGRPTVHRAFDEATAILAGDALLTLAFEIIAAPETCADAEVRAALAVALARAAGPAGMVGGQMLDLAAEGRFAAAREALDETAVRRLQQLKTGALIRFACEAGAMLGQASEEDLGRLVRYGEIVGLAFQLADDLLDVTGSAEVVGKATAKDSGKGKATLVSLHGVDGVRRMLDDLVAEAEACLEPYGGRGTVLRAAARYVAARER